MNHLIRAATLTMIFALVAYAFTGCGDSTTNAAGTEVTFDNSAVTTLGITNSPITADQARQIAETATGGTALNVEQENENHVELFDVDIQLGSSTTDVKVRISDGAVMKVEADDEDDDENDDDEGENLEEVTPDNSIAKSLGITSGPITDDQAVQIATKALPGTVQEVEEDSESDIPVIDVELQSDSGTKEVTIRASDGAIMKIESDDNDQDDDDQGDD
jgi:uncharacterized membrane protein YkoI